MSRSGPLLRNAVSRMESADVASPRVDAELLLAYALGVSRMRLLLVDEVPSSVAERFEALIDRRVAREPLQYLLGTAPFRYLELAVGPGVFVPRPETELLVDAVLPRLARLDRPLVVDLCAGSGALALAVAAEVDAARVVAVERSPAALAWLRRNVDSLGLADRVSVIAADVAEPGDALVRFYGSADAVVSNPPYVPAGTAVGPEVEQDPPEAVFAGDAGLDLIPAVLDLAAMLLKPGGVLAMEHDASQGASVPARLTPDGWTDVVDHLDLAGRPRFVTATRAGAG